MDSQQLPSLGTFIQVFFLMGFIGLIYESTAYSINCSRDGQAKRFTLDAIRAPKNSYFRYTGSINPLAIIPGSITNGLIYGSGVIGMILMNHYLPPTIPIWPRVIMFGASASILELLVGLTVNKNHNQWDYRGNFGNIAGQTDASHFVLWGLAGAFCVFVLYPRLLPTMARVNAVGEKHTYIVSTLLIAAALIAISVERDYPASDPPYAIRFFNWMEPSWPKARTKC